MPYCPKCSSEVDEKMAFCPKCGASLKIEQPADWKEEMRAKREEWREWSRDLRRQRREARRNEKEMEWEKREKHEYVFFGPLVGGLVLTMFGALFYFFVTEGFDVEILAALFFVLVGVIIIGATLYGVIVAERRHPRT